MIKKNGKNVGNTNIKNCKIINKLDLYKLSTHLFLNWWYRHK
ncbi:hypothetical protein RRG49_04780 [Mycoplasmopsis felis]|nr:hypothetical protein [Mycoplasmopsis felis]WQQ09096.1 hypothetical protein RRG41_03085 [Mycoplasmopsis felis]WQQ10737.1 hypothetical protein RRG45_03125 [Mycoplasmopsis felis]